MLPGSRGRGMLHHDFGLKAFNIAEDRGDGEHAPLALEP